MTVSLLIRPRDPMMFRDGRPFNAGQGARTIGFPLPSTVAGYVRTRLYGEENFRSPSFTPEEKKRVLAVSLKGPFLACQTHENKWELAFSAPADAAAYEAGKANLEIAPLRPARGWPEGSGCDLPHLGETQLVPLTGLENRKASEHSPPYWTATQTLSWLAQTGFQKWYKTPNEMGFQALPEQARIHTEIQSERRNVKETMLFRTTSLEFEYDGEFHSSPSDPERPPKRRGVRAPLARGVFAGVEAPGGRWANPDGLAPFSGERRLAVWSTVDDLLPPPQAVDGNLIRLQLVTPGRFGNGWCPAWVSQGTPPDCRGLKLKLISAAVKRAVPISGFDMTKKGPDRIRSTRFLAPAGSVYFFEVLEGDPRRLWLQSISDSEQDRLDGFGLVLMGGWQWR